MESKQEKKTVSFLHQIEEFEKEFQDKEMEMKSFRNQSIIGLLLLVFFGYLVF